MLRYGYDIRNLDGQFHHIRNVSYDEKKFSKDPTGQVFIEPSLSF